jgi:methylmalonyl-CoA decarboxylase subunit alpha
MFSSRHRCVNFGMDKVDIPSDGVITGHGKVEGRPVFAFAQDFTARAGSLGEMHAKKICKVMDLALKAGVPVVGFNDSGGARIQEGVDALFGYGEIFYRNSIWLRRHPPDFGHHGAHGGRRGLFPGHDRLRVHGQKTSHMFITGPQVIKSVTGEEISFEDLGGAMTHNEKSGVCAFRMRIRCDAIESHRKPCSPFSPQTIWKIRRSWTPAMIPGRMDPALDTWFRRM